MFVLLLPSSQPLLTQFCSSANICEHFYYCRHESAHGIFSDSLCRTSNVRWSSMQLLFNHRSPLQLLFNHRSGVPCSCSAAALQLPQWGPLQLLFNHRSGVLCSGATVVKV